jgi:hypothetical protein
MLWEFHDSEDKDCKINAYKYLGGGGTKKADGNGHSSSSSSSYNNPYDYDSNSKLSSRRSTAAKQIQQRAEAEAAPTLLDIDLDRKSFLSDRAHQNALKKTLAKINEVFLLSPDEGSPATVYWSGGGNHILLPLEVDPQKYPAENSFTLEQTVPGRDLRFASFFTGGNDYRFSANHKLPANLFLWFAEDYLSGGTADTSHNSSVRSSMTRIPGSYNSKYYDKDKEKSEVKVLQRWDGYTKAHILFLLGAFYRNLEADYKKRERLFRKARRVKFNRQTPQIALDRTLEVLPVPGFIAMMAFGEGTYSNYAHHKYWYINKLLQTPVPDFRKRGIDLLLAPYLITIKDMSDIAAERIILDWLNRCEALRPLDFDPYSRVQSKITDIVARKRSSDPFLPMGEEKFKVEDYALFSRLSRDRGKVGGGN